MNLFADEFSFEDADQYAGGRFPRLPVSHVRTLEEAQLLIETMDVNSKNGWGGTPLHFAKSPEVVSFLINKKADVNAKAGYYRETPLHEAESAEVAKLLIDNKADVNAKNRDNKAPAFCWGEGWNSGAGMVSQLLSKGVVFGTESFPVHFMNLFNQKEKISFLRSATFTDPNSLWPFWVKNNRVLLEIILNRGADPFHDHPDPMRRSGPMIDRFPKDLQDNINLEYISAIESSTQMSPTVSSLIHRCINPESIFKFG